MVHEIEGCTGGGGGRVRRERSEMFCGDACWEGVMAIGREEQYRRGYFAGARGG